MASCRRAALGTKVTYFTPKDVKVKEAIWRRLHIGFNGSMVEVEALLGGKCPVDPSRRPLDTVGRSRISGRFRMWRRTGAPPSTGGGATRQVGSSDDC